MFRQENIQMWYKAANNIKRGLEWKHSQLNKQVEELNRISQSNEVPPWASDLMKAYAQPDYRFTHMLQIMRKNKFL